MSDLTRVNFGALDSIQGDLRNSSSKFEAGFAEMDTELRNQTSEWGGDAKEAYENFARRVQQCLKEMREALDKMPPALVTAKESAERAEKANAALFQ